MSIKRILAAAAASVVTVSAMSAVAFAGITNASDANGNYMVDLIEEGYTVTDVYGLTVTISGDYACLLYTSPSPRDVEESRFPSSAW